MFMNSSAHILALVKKIPLRLYYLKAKSNESWCTLDNWNDLRYKINIDLHSFSILCRFTSRSCRIWLLDLIPDKCSIKYVPFWKAEFQSSGIDFFRYLWDEMGNQWQNCPFRSEIKCVCRQFIYNSFNSVEWTSLSLPFIFWDYKRTDF